MRIELLYFEGCPGARKTLNAIEGLVAEAKIEAEVVPIEVGDGSYPGFSGSPTVLVDGEDPFPAARVDTLSCRLYETPEGRRNSPTDAMLRTAIGEKIGAQAEAR